jgi:hypothetical protein
MNQIYTKLKTISFKKCVNSKTDSHYDLQLSFEIFFCLISINVMDKNKL